MLSIGELGQRTGVKVPTIRYYEQIGLLPPPPRTEGQQRRYSEGAAARLNFIRHARDLGFEVEAIRELLAIVPSLTVRVPRWIRSPAATCPRWSVASGSLLPFGPSCTGCWTS